MKCAHCQAPKAAHRWSIQACADKRRVRSKWLCTPCDIQLNALVLAFVSDAKAAEKMAAYQARMAEP